jgi:hypothetical protein
MMHLYLLHNLWKYELVWISRKKIKGENTGRNAMTKKGQKVEGDVIVLLGSANISCIESYAP